MTPVRFAKRAVWMNFEGTWKEQKEKLRKERAEKRRLAKKEEKEAKKLRRRDEYLWKINARAEGRCVRCYDKKVEAPSIHCEECLEALRIAQRQRREKARQESRTAHQKIRDKVYELYGGKCTSCGFDNPLAFHLHHVEFDGKEDREVRGPKIFKYLAENFYPEVTKKYTLLCANCHTILHRMYGKERS